MNILITGVGLNNVWRTSSYNTETHHVSTAMTNRLMLFGKIIAVYCEIHTNNISTIYGYMKNMFEVKSDNITYSNHFALKCLLYTSDKRVI